MAEENEFLAGVIEGFYGQPWSQSERFQLFTWLKDWGLNTYFYAPKDDLKHRALWRELYSDEETLELTAIISGCKAQGLRFIYGIAPGLDITYSDEWELTVLKVKLEQLQKLGCQDFALLFDDVPDTLRWKEVEKFGSLAKAQYSVANSIASFFPNSRLLFCPTAYCGRMVNSNLGGADYLPSIGKGLSSRFDIFWTGPEIISPEISVQHIQDIQAILHRKPVIWDNLHANDYDGRRFYCGPYSGREPALKNEVAGILTNPNSEFPLNFIPIRTLATYLRALVDDPRNLYVNALKEWHPYFDTIEGPVDLKDLSLFGDCFYLPFQNGDYAESLFQQIKRDLKRKGRILAIQRLREFCCSLTLLKDRSLFRALHRRAWDLKEELDLLEKFLNGQNRSDFHLPGTYRGGFITQLQSLLKQKPDGTFEP